MMVRQLIAYLCIFVIGSVSLAQTVGRNSPRLPMLSTPLAVLSEGRGWIKDDLGEWHSSERLIGYQRGSRADLGTSDFHRSKFEDYSTIKLRRLTVAGEEYYTLEKNHTMGAYVYPSIYQDWYTFDVTDLCAFEKSELAKLGEAIEEKGKAQRITINCIYGPVIEGGNNQHGTVEQRLIRRISLAHKAAIRDPSWNPNDIYRLLLDVFPVEYQGKDVVRFLWSESGKSQRASPFARQIFNGRYYEVSKDSFLLLTRP